jgi:hypothetical protein
VGATAVPLPAETISLYNNSQAILLGAVVGPQPRGAVRPLPVSLFCFILGLGESISLVSNPSHAGEH